MTFYLKFSLTSETTLLFLTFAAGNFLFFLYLNTDFDFHSCFPIVFPHLLIFEFSHITVELSGPE